MNYFLNKKHQLRIFCILCFCFLCYRSTLISQIAVINSKQVYQSIPQFVIADSLIHKEQQRLAQEYFKMKLKTQIQSGKADSLYRINPKDSATLGEIQLSQRMNLELVAFEKNANTQLDQFRDVMFTPYIDKVKMAVKTIADRLKYMQVIDISVLPMYYFNEKSDITTLVIKELKK